MISEPVPGYGWRPPGSPFSAGHQAVDIPAPLGTPVVAVADGVVRSAGDDSRLPYNLDLSEWGGGTMVTIDHAAGGQEAVSQYAHLSAASVRAGELVRAGDRIGLVGSTGNSTGPHLHFGWRVGGVWRDYRSEQGAVTMPGNIPEGYGSGPVQNPPADPFGNPIAAYPLDKGKSCAPGYRPGLVDPRLHAAIPGNVWFNRAWVGKAVACVRDDLGPGDQANFASGQGVGAVLDAAGDLARNGLLLAGLIVLALIAVWILVRGSGGGGAAVAV